MTQQNISDALQKLGLSRKKTRVAKLAGEASAPDELNRLLGNGEIVVVDCACVGDN